MAADEKMKKDALAYLQSASTDSGDNAYDHLASILLKLLEERPKDAVDLLEISNLVKKTKFKPLENPALRPAVAAPKDTAHAVKIADLYSAPVPEIDPETGEPEEVDPPNEFETENMLVDSALFAAVGVGMGPIESYNVMLAMKKLGEDPEKKVATIRFFGKIFGIKQNYYVFESTLQEMPDEEDPDKPPPWGRPAGGAPVEHNTGPNAYVYWVCNYPGGPMTQLPHVTPLQIKRARQLKKLLTGDLKAEVIGFPPFPGCEENLLRAQLARIAATTNLCPKGFFSEGEDGALEKAEDYAPPAPGEPMDLEAWVHRYPHIKKQGRCQVWVPEPEGDEEEERQPTEEEQEESPALLTSIEEDSPLAGEAPAWTVISSSKVPATMHKVWGVRSNLWPGAATIATPTGFSNVYIGWGVKNQMFVPMPPPAICEEFDGSLIESVELPPKPEQKLSDEEKEDEEEEEED